MQLNQVQRFPNSMNYPSKYRNRLAAECTPKSTNYNYCPCAGLEYNRPSDNVLQEPPAPPPPRLEEYDENTASAHSKATACPCQSAPAIAPDTEYLSLATSRDDERLQRLSRPQSSTSQRRPESDAMDVTRQLQAASRMADKPAMDETRNYVIRHLLVQAITLMDGCDCPSSNGPSQRGTEPDEEKCALQITNASRLEVVKGTLSTSCPQATITVPVSSFPCAILFKPNADNTDFNVTHVPLSTAAGAKVFGAPYGATPIYGDFDGPCPATSQSGTKSAGVASLKEITDTSEADSPTGPICVDKCQNTDLGGLGANGMQCICVEKSSVTTTKRTDDLEQTPETDPSQASTKVAAADPSQPSDYPEDECDCPAVASAMGAAAASELESPEDECVCDPSIASAKGVPGASDVCDISAKGAAGTCGMEYPVCDIAKCACVPSSSFIKDPSERAKAQSEPSEASLKEKGDVEGAPQDSEHAMPPTKVLDDGLASKPACDMGKVECNEEQCDCADRVSASLSAGKGETSKIESGEVDKQASSADTAADESGSKSGLDDKESTAADEAKAVDQEGKDDTQTSEHSLASKKDADDRISTTDGAAIVDSVLKETVTSDQSLSSKKEPSTAEEVTRALSSVSSKKEPSMGMSEAECSDAECACANKPSEARTTDKEPSELAKSLASAASEAPTQMDDIVCSNAACDCVNKPSEFSQKQTPSEAKSLEVSTKPSEVSAALTKGSTGLDDVLCSNTSCECINRPTAFSRSATSAGLKKSLGDVSATSTKGPTSVLECKCDFSTFKGDSRAILAQYECELDDTECEAAREELYKRLNMTKPSASLTEGRATSPATCNCCYCETRRREQNAGAQKADAQNADAPNANAQYANEEFNAEMLPMPAMSRRPEEEVYDDGASAAAPGGLQADYKEMKFFIDSLVFDYEVMQAIRQKSKGRSCGCSSKSLENMPEGDGYPATITDVRRVGCKALFVNWMVRNGIEVAGFELYLDDVLYNRYRSSDHRAGLIYNVDIKVKHIVMLKTLPVGYDDCGCNYVGGRDADIATKSWSPSVYVYEPGSRKSNKQPEPVAAAQVEETNE